jgi:hypothetical protein
MIRTVFLAVTMIAASLGVAAKANLTQQGTGVQTAAVQPAAQNQPGNSASPAADDSSRQTATAGNASDVKQTHGEETAASNPQLPQTSTILPLLGLIGLGSLVAGFFARR